MNKWRLNKITLKKIWSNVMETLDRQPLKHLLLESSLALLSRYNKTGTWRLQKECLFFRVVILEHFVACVWNWDKTMAILKINEKRQNLKTKQFKNSKHRSPYWKNKKTLHNKSKVKKEIHLQFSGCSWNAIPVIGYVAFTTVVFVGNLAITYRTCTATPMIAICKMNPAE